MKTTTNHNQSVKKGEVKFDPYQHITDIIISRLENGELPWVRRYSKEQKAMGPARNGKSGREYTGINRLLLPFPGRYYTFNNVQQMGGRVKAGSKSFTAVFFKMVEKKFVIEKTDEDTGETVTKEGKQFIPVPRVYGLFHESQVELPESENTPKPLEDPARYDGEPVEDAENIIMTYRLREGVNIVDDAEDPGYEVATDTIFIPARGRYAKAEGYYNDLFHELVHSTGHPSRLNRELPAVAAAHGKQYSREELVSTIGSAFLMSEAEMDSLEAVDSVAAEAGHWIEALRADKRMIVWCSTRASKSVNFIMTGKTAETEDSAVN